MAIHIKTKAPQQLLNKFKEKIDSGSITKWSYDKEGDFTYTAEQWKNMAWLRPRVRDEELIFNILGKKGVVMKSLTYAVYHGRFIESLLNHCDQLFKSIQSSALPESGDAIGSSDS